MKQTKVRLKRILTLVSKSRQMTVSMLVLVSILATTATYFSKPLIEQVLGASQLKGQALLEYYADRVSSNCAQAKFAPSCYDEEIPKLMDNISMEDAFKVARIVQQKEPSYVYCHVLAHNISYRETTKHPDQWKDIITRCPQTMCNNGCPHGVLLKKFSSDSLTDEQIEKLKPDILDLCEPRKSWNPVRVEVSMCYHAIGHLNMYITKGNLAKSVSLCEFAGKKPDGRDYVHTCTQGVFMQVFQPLEPEDYALVKGITPLKDGVEEFCKPYFGQAFNACWTESWPLWRADLYDPGASNRFCSRLGDETSVKECHAGLMSFLTVDFIMTRGDYDQLKTYCSGMPIVSECFDHAARRLLQIDPVLVDKSLQVCGYASSVGVGWECYRSMASYSRQDFRPDTPEFIKYCATLPKAWNETCLRGEENAPPPVKDK